MAQAHRRWAISHFVWPSTQLPRALLSSLLCSGKRKLRASASGSELRLREPGTGKLLCVATCDDVSQVADRRSRIGSHGAPPPPAPRREAGGLCGGGAHAHARPTTDAPAARSFFVLVALSAVHCVFIRSFCVCQGLTPVEGPSPCALHNCTARIVATIGAWW
jgi:hypothetical protein